MEGKDGCRGGLEAATISGQANFLFIWEKSGNFDNWCLWQTCQKRKASRGSKRMNTQRVRNKTYLPIFFSYLSFLLVQTERAWFDIINTVESRYLEVSISNLSLSVSLTIRYSWIQLYINQCGLFSLPGMVKHSSSTRERCPFPAVWERLWRIKDICDSELFSKDGGRWLAVHCS